MQKPKGSKYSTFFRIMDNQNMSIVIKISFKNLPNEIVDKFDVAPPMWESYQTVEKNFRASVEIRDNAIEIGSIILYSSPHTKQIDVEQEAAKIAIVHLKDMFNFEVDDFNLHDTEMYHQHLEQADFALVEALQENKALKNEIAKIRTKAKDAKIMN
ncbi:hypothetical protein RHSIM_RhsimUnG0087100 [Rhododendron simsii]|uniref:Uncharacterized protein n=1 Tax=Rhododendron simsii TaxID=118357 RepID=A0A834FVD1_RHOSS|nr:hypothetical protein RHSIM_RhsimUnG0087100 [Rhododendron simsii]